MRRSFRRCGSGALQPPFVLEESLVAHDAQAAGDRERQHLRRETPHVVTHAHQETQARRRLPVRRLVARDDDALVWIAPDARPLAHAVADQQNQTQQRDENAAVVLQQPSETLCEARRGNQALRKAEHDREAFARIQRPRELPARVAGLDDFGAVILVLRALIARVTLGFQLIDLHRRRQVRVDGAAIDGKRPAGADRVPVQLVVVREEAELTRRAIAQRVRVLGGHGQEIVVAGVDAHAVVAALP